MSKVSWNRRDENRLRTLEVATVKENRTTIFIGRVDTAATGESNSFNSVSLWAGSPSDRVNIFQNAVICSNLIVRIPTNNKDGFDINKQREIAEKYEKVYRTRDDIVQYLQSLSKIIVSM